MTFRELVRDEKADRQGATHVAVVRHDDLTEAGAGTAQTLSLDSPVADEAFDALYFELKEGFEDVSDATFDAVGLEIGDTGDVARFIASTEVGEQAAATRKIGTSILAAFLHVYLAADTLGAKFTPLAGKSLSLLDKGEVRIYLRIVNAN